MAKKLVCPVIALTCFCVIPLVFILPHASIVLASIVEVEKEPKDSFVDLQLNKNENDFELIISNIGTNPEYFQISEDNNLIFKITSKGIDLRKVGATQTFSLPSSGIRIASLEHREDFLTLLLVPEGGNSLPEFNIFTRSNDLVFSFPKSNYSLNNNLNNLFSPNTGLASVKNNTHKAIAPPLGDIAIGTRLITNPNLVDIEGPKVTLISDNMEARAALEYLISQVGYDFVWVQGDPLYEKNNSSLSQYGASPSTTNPTTDSPRLITLALRDQPFSKALNSVLIASGLQAKLEENVIYVGPNVRTTILSDRISRIYRLNQTTANAAASYLANLGAKVTKTSTISTAVTQGSSQSQTIAGSSTASTTTQTTKTSVEVYGSDIGPLIGLIATTDDRLETITLIGSKSIVKVAEGYLKQLDLRQRQVALTVRILDINLSDGKTINNSWSMRQNNNFIVNDNGKLLTAFGKNLPASESDFSDTKTTKTITTTNETTTESSYSRGIRMNPVLEYADLSFLDFLKAQIASKNTKILASPTLILNEYPGKAGGDTVSFSDISSSLTAGTIGRSYGNEAFVVVGTQVPVNCTSEQDSSVPSFSYGIKGLTFGARIMRIDDNGFVTFAISPSVTVASEQRNITNCGTIDLLATRRLDSGSIRVRDGNTLILTGVLNSEDKETVTKFPLLGDMPLIGQFFRNTASSKVENELVILVTPQILKGGDDSITDSLYKPRFDSTKEIINSSNE